MFERFTREAREIVVRAQETAQGVGSPGIDSRHLLLALAESDALPSGPLRAAGGDPATVVRCIRDDIAASGLDREALASLGIDLDAVSERADEVFGPGSLWQAGRRRGRLPFTPDAKKALELALREAVRLKARSIESRHLALGVLRGDCPGRAVLIHQGVDVGALREALERPEAASA